MLPGKHDEAIVHRHDEGVLVDEQGDAPDTMLLEPSDTLLEREHVEPLIGHGNITVRPRTEPAHRIASYASDASSRENGCTWARIFPASPNPTTPSALGAIPSRCSRPILRIEVRRSSPAGYRRCGRASLPGPFARVSVPSWHYSGWGVSRIGQGRAHDQDRARAVAYHRSRNAAERHRAPARYARALRSRRAQVRR